MKLTILGCYSATPRTDTNPTSQVLEINNHMFLIDCGEGTQVELRRNKIKFARIKHIFISHLHGDHFFGLVGLISTFRLLTRETELHIYCPKGLKEEITIVSGVSSTIISTPVKRSNALIFLPSRPIILPFKSSSGRVKVVVVISAI